MDRHIQLLSYNYIKVLQMAILSRFASKRDIRQKPAVLIILPQLKRKETSIYKPTDLWTQDDDQLFLKYCPSKTRKMLSYDF